MKTFALMSMLGSLTLGGVAWAERPASFGDPALSLDAIQSADRAARTQVLAALVEGATLPAQAPTLPDQASDRAREVHQTIAFGQKGAAQRAAHAHADRAAKAAAKQAREDAANRAARGAAASASRSANADSHAAAGQARAAEARAQHGNGNGNGVGHNNGKGQGNGHGNAP